MTNKTIFIVNTIDNLNRTRQLAVEALSIAEDITPLWTGSPEDFYSQGFTLDQAGGFYLDGSDMAFDQAIKDAHDLALGKPIARGVDLVNTCESYFAGQDQGILDAWQLILQPTVGSLRSNAQSGSSALTEAQYLDTVAKVSSLEWAIVESLSTVSGWHQFTLAPLNEELFNMGKATLVQVASAWGDTVIFGA